MFFLLDISKNRSYYKIVLKKKQFGNKKEAIADITENWLIIYQETIIMRKFLNTILNIWNPENIYEVNDDIFDEA